VLEPVMLDLTGAQLAETLARAHPIDHWPKTSEKDAAAEEAVPYT
jgi:hypothetical protein